MWQSHEIIASYFERLPQPPDPLTGGSDQNPYCVETKKWILNQVQHDGGGFVGMVKIEKLTKNKILSFKIIKLC